MSTWEALATQLARLQADPRRPLRSFPDPSVHDRRAPPFPISLAPWAESIAADLHTEFRDEVILTVGFLRYPSRAYRDSRGRLIDPPVLESLPVLNRGVVARLAAPLVVRSGFDERGDLEISNESDEAIAIHTNGVLVALVLDPRTGQVVGGYSGAQTLPLVIFSIGKRQRVTIPLLVGTSSFRSELGYAVPPGAWTARALIECSDHRRYLTPQIPIEVTR